MAGTIKITKGAECSAATWLYEWALKIASEQVRDLALKQKLQDVIDSNVGWVDLGGFSLTERAEMAEALHSALVPESDRRLPATVPNRSPGTRLFPRVGPLGIHRHTTVVVAQCRGLSAVLGRCWAG